MISSGWILPDMSSISCKSSSSNKEHIGIVEDYLDHLFEKDKHLYYTLMNLKAIIQPECDSLDDFAVKILGWIKITNLPFKRIYALNLYEYETLLKTYSNLGYMVTTLIGKPPIKIKHPNQYL